MGGSGSTSLLRSSQAQPLRWTCAPRSRLGRCPCPVLRDGGLPGETTDCPLGGREGRRLPWTGRRAAARLMTNRPWRAADTGRRGPRDLPRAIKLWARRHRPGCNRLHFGGVPLCRTGTWGLLICHVVLRRVRCRAGAQRRRETRHGGPDDATDRPNRGLPRRPDLVMAMGGTPLVRTQSQTRWSCTAR